MRALLSALIMTSTLPGAADTAAVPATGNDGEPAPAAPPTPRKIPAIAALPDGSELEGVVLPRYDQLLRLTGTLRAETLTLVNIEEVRGKNVTIKLNNPETSATRVRVDLADALLNQVSGIIRANEAITIIADQFTATGTALHFAFEDGRGFISGPATTTIINGTSTAMTPQSIIHKQSARLLATAAVGITMATIPVNHSHARPQPLSPEELAALHHEAASRANAAKEQAAATSDILSETGALSLALSTATQTFLINNVPEAADPATPDDPAPAKPLEIQPGPDDTRIEADGGFYFDTEANVLVYLNNVRVTDPRFTLTGVDELKVIFTKKEHDGAQPNKDRTDDLAAGFTSSIGDVERVIATGRVLFKQSRPLDGKPPIEASGALFSYDLAREQIVISGGFPWVRQGDYYARALEPALNLRINRDGSFVTEGRWDTGGNARQDR